MTRRFTTHVAYALLTLLIVPVVAGCGYGLVGRTSSLPPDVVNIYIAPLGNRTLRQQVDLILTQAIADEFLRRPDSRWSTARSRPTRPCAARSRASGYGPFSSAPPRGGPATTRSR